MVKEDLKALRLDGDLADDNETKTKFSHDASIFEIIPEIVVFPKSVEDIKKIVKYATLSKSHGQKVAITPRAAGTDMTGAAIGESIVLEFTKYFNNIIEVTEDYAITQPGVYYRDFEKKTLEKGSIFPPFPASRELCALGGMIANNCAGEKTLTHGKMENYILEMNCVLADGNEYLIKPLGQTELAAKLEQKDFEGELYRKIHQLIIDNEEIIAAAKPNVSKNSAGYYLWNVWDKEKKTFDLTKLMVGSQGTLGVITQAKLRLEPVNKHSKLLVVFLNDLKYLAEIVNTILPFKPETLESFDDHTLRIAMRFIVDLVKILKPKNLFKLGLQFLPEVWMALSGGFPKLILMVEFSGNDEDEIDRKLQLTNLALAQFKVKTHVTKTEQEASKYWVIRHESFNLLRKHVHGKRTAPFIDDIVVRPQHLPEFLPKLNRILENYNLIYTIAGHVGDGNFHIIPLMDFKDPKTPEIITKLSDEVYALVMSYHGSITAEHNDGLVRGPYLQLMYGSRIHSLFKEVKKTFDPLDIFNPGKKADADWQYALEHMVKTS